ncbi:MAG: hypothetical protein ACI82F_003436 [Planctomycetota bacterium]
MESILRSRRLGRRADQGIGDDEDGVPKGAEYAGLYVRQLRARSLQGYELKGIEVGVLAGSSPA